MKLKRKQWLWPLVGIVALLSTFLFVGGFSYAVHEVLQPETAQAELAGEVIMPNKASSWIVHDEIHVLALGDSLTKGIGDEEAKGGYVGDVQQMLQAASGKPVRLWNFAISGYRTDQLLTDLQSGQIGADDIKKADIILLTIGGNDLNQAVAKLQTGDQGGAAATAEQQSLAFAEAAKKLPDSMEMLNAIFVKLAEANPTAKIVYVGLYHPFLSYDPQRQGSAVVQQWNYGAFLRANAYSNITVVPTYDLFQNHLNELLSNDHFHPNSKGYREIAARVFQGL